LLARIVTPVPVDGGLLTAAVAVVISAVGALAVATILADRRGLVPHSAIRFGQWTATLAAALSLGAAAIHFATIADHFTEYPPYGIAFAAFAWFQVGWAAAYVAGRQRLVAVAAIAVNAGGLFVWAVSRSVGLPFGPDAGQLEPVGPPALAAAALEIGLITLLAWDLLVDTSRLRPALPATGATVVVGSGALAVIMLTFVAIAVTGGEPHDGAGHEASTAVAPSRATAEPGAGVAAPSVPPPTTGVSPLETIGPGTVHFGAALDLTGEIATPGARFRPGAKAIWIAQFNEAPDVPTIQLLIVEVLADGREFEHLRQDIALDDPGGTRLVAGADLSIYVHGGEGRYRMRYLRRGHVLAEGAFEFVP